MNRLAYNVDDASLLASHVETERRLLIGHKIFGQIHSHGQLRNFMQWHVYAVWDFMTLLKRLQRDLTSIEVPWVPPPLPGAARLINEIVLGEETDELPGNGHLSHFELYLQAMQAVGADTAEMKRFVAEFSRTQDLDAAFTAAETPAPVAAFVKVTLGTALNGTLPEVLGSFFYGREDVIPAMFSRLLKDWSVDPSEVPMFAYYLERHIELDGDHHGPAAKSIIKAAVGNDQQRRQQLYAGAIAALSARRALWDAFCERAL